MTKLSLQHTKLEGIARHVMQMFRYVSLAQQMKTADHAADIRISN